MLASRHLLALAALACLATGAVALAEGCDCARLDLTPAPVCGSNSVTYANRCVAECQGIYVLYEAPCGSDFGLALKSSSPSEAGTPAAQGPKPCVPAFVPNASISAAELQALNDLGFTFAGVAEEGAAGDEAAIPPPTSATFAGDDIALPGKIAYISADGKLSLRGLSRPSGASSGLLPPSRAPGRASRRLLAIKGGSDGRRKVTAQAATSYPFNTVGYLSNGCSGTLVGKRAVLTAAHCVLDTSGSSDAWRPRGISQITFTPAQAEGVTGLRAARVTGAVVPYFSIEDFAYEYDWALLFLDADLGSTMGWMGLGYTCDTKTYKVTNAGYPGDLPLGSNGRPTMYAQDGTLDAFSGCGLSRRANVVDSPDLDAWHGQSGSSIFELGSATIRAMVNGGSCGQDGVDAGRCSKQGGSNYFRTISSWVFDNLKDDLARFSA